MCKKTKYRDRIAAAVALADTNRARSGRRNETRVYYCQSCKGWHLTSQSKKAKLSSEVNYAKKTSRKDGTPSSHRNSS